ncbi:MAG: C25 family cysteine peptidase, partial [Candidatus Thermoplasmatota archaeon]
YDLLILTPTKYVEFLNPLADHKNNFEIATKIVTLDTVYEEMYWFGRDQQEKIKYFIKESIEKWGITHVLLIGGLNGQTTTWDLPIRYSHVVPPDEQEYAEQYFISDLYYADIYNSFGEFSSWDSNNDNIFSVWNETYSEKMDLYPDVYLGRLPCRNSNEVKIMVDKIINYEMDKLSDEWFNNLLLVAGDSYNDTAHFNEGELISEKAIELMPDFTPVKIYSSEQDINRKTVNTAMNQGSGFAYFCGHGSPASWSTHFPPDGNEWTTGYNVNDMIYLRNKEKLPITVVGGCHNGEFSVSIMNLFKGILEHGFKEYFFQPPFWFYYNKWIPNCWAWWLTSKSNGGAIATIANTGLGTHGEDDSDNNSVADYLEVLDGWLELKFLQLYGENNYDCLGENHGDSLSGYLNRFLGDNAKMDVKMVQQWELFGDPSLKIGGYDKS